MPERRRNKGANSPSETATPTPKSAPPKKAGKKDGKSAKNNRGPKGDDENTAAPPPSQGNLKDSAAPPPSQGNLKDFVEQFKDKHYHVIEMRILLICCFGIFLKLFFSDELSQREDPLLMYSALLFIGLSVIVIIFSTWMDYFPSRLVEVEPRESRGQGIPMACLFLPMVCSAQLYFALHYAKHMTGLLEVYLVVLCFLSVCSVLATMFHFIPHPNHVVVYNLAAIVLSYLLQVTVGVSMWITLPAVAVYSLLGAWLLNELPKSFTIGEAMIVCQGLTLLLLDCSIQLLRLYELVPVPDSLHFLRSESVLYVELLVLGVAVCCLLLSPALYKLSQAKQYYERKFWSGTFILLSLSIGFMLILPWLKRLLHDHHPIPYLFSFSLATNTRCILVGMWLGVCLVTGILMCAQSANASSWITHFKITSSSGDIRKLFHFSALLVYVSGTVSDPSFMAMAASLVTFLFLVAELGRIFRMWPFGESLHQLFLPFLNSADSGTAVVSYIYLLLGFSLPLWCYPLTRYNHVLKLSMYSGVLAVGVGDAMASIAGRHLGKVKWPGTEKTVEGSLASLLAQLLGVLLLTRIDPDLPALSAHQWGIVTGSVAITTALEAYTWQLDNLILSPCLYSLLVTFLS